MSEGESEYSPSLLFWQGHFEHLAVCVLAMNDVHHLGYDGWVLSGEVGVLVNVSGEVVEIGCTTLDHQLPVAHAQGHHIGLVKLPVEEVVLLLLGIIALECLTEGDTIISVLGGASLQAIRLGIQASIL